MDVYVEWVLLDNFVIDLFVLYVAAAVLKLSVAKWRVACGAVVGAVGAVLSVFAVGLWAWLYKTVLLVAMCICVVGVGKKLFWYVIATLICTFVLGGAIGGLFYLFQVDYVSNNGVLFALTNVPFGCYFGAFLLVAFVVKSLAVYVAQSKKILQHVVRAKLLVSDKWMTISAFRDTGNTLECNGHAVCFVVGKIGGFADYYARCLLQGKFQTVEVCTVADCKKVVAVSAVLQVDGEEERQVYLALPLKKCPSLYQLIIDG